MAEGLKSKKWWQTIPGILKATAAIITGLAGLIVALQQIGFLEKKDDKQRQVVSQAPIEGRWILRHETQAPDHRVNLGHWMRIKLKGTHLEVWGDKGWTGQGSFDEQDGSYDWKFTDGRTGITKIHLDETGILHGDVKGSGINWTYWASRQIE